MMRRNFGIHQKHFNKRLENEGLGCLFKSYRRVLDLGVRGEGFAAQALQWKG